VSEYQYYGFQAIDRPLTDRHMQALRAISSRATITRTRFSNYIAPEALRNAFRHARAERMEAEVTYGAREVRLRIRDDERASTEASDAGRVRHWVLRGAAALRTALPDFVRTLRQLLETTERDRKRRGGLHQALTRFSGQAVRPAAAAAVHSSVSNVAITTSAPTESCQARAEASCTAS
jgi:hypothetical protein